MVRARVRSVRSATFHQRSLSAPLMRLCPLHRSASLAVPVCPSACCRGSYQQRNPRVFRWGVVVLLVVVVCVCVRVRAYVCGGVCGKRGRRGCGTALLCSPAQPAIIRLAMSSRRPADWGPKRLRTASPRRRQSLDEVARLFDSGAIRVNISHRLSLAQAPEAFRRAAAAQPADQGAGMRPLGPCAPCACLPSPAFFRRARPHLAPLPSAARRPHVRRRPLPRSARCAAS